MPALLSALISALLLVATLSVAQAQQRLRIGILAYLGVEHSEDDWAPTLSAIRASLGEDTAVEVRPLDHAGLSQALEQRSVDFVITNPGHYVELELSHGISRILTRQSSDPIASTVVARAAATDLQTLKDLKGRSIAIVGREAFGGFQVGWREMVDVGIDPDRDTRLKSTGFPMTRVLDEVISGAVDAGIVRACILERQIATGAVAANTLKVVGESGRAGPCALSSRVYPDWPIAKARETDPELAKKVATALLSWTPPKGEAGWTVPLDYQPVLELFRDLKIGPYDYLRHESLSAFLWRMRHWLALTGVALLAWLIHVARVELLVRRRTVDLERAHHALVQEMTARRAAEDRDALHLRELDHAGRLSMVGEMASGLAHELNQPLAAIVNYADGCAFRLKSGQNDPQSLLVATTRIQEQAERAARIIQQMRAFVRKRDAELRPCDLNTVVQETLLLFEGMVRRTGAIVTLNLEPTLARVNADKIQIQQVLLNLFQNGLDAMSGITGERHLEVATRLAKAGVEVEVRDNGHGLPDDAWQRMFEPFFTTKPDGLGLGLSLCKSIAEAHNGTLDARPGEGGGTVMTLWLPKTGPES